MLILPKHWLKQTIALNDEKNSTNTNVIYFFVSMSEFGLSMGN